MTYSIIAFDPDTGECGVAVQSHWFSVGSIVPWAEPGIGAVATQAMGETSYGPLGLERMREGATAAEALAERVAADPMAQVRQVAMVDTRGGVAAHTGSRCMPFAGQVVGRHHSCQANLMADERVWGAMSEAYLGAAGRLANRLLDALDAGEAAGGDLRGRQSAALLVVPAEGEPWRRTVELRVEDHADPLVELRRLVDVHESYAMVREADELSLNGSDLAAVDVYVAAWERVPERDELKFWAALALVERGEGERGAALLREAIEVHAGWQRLVDQLDPEQAPSIEEARRLLGDMRPEDAGVDRPSGSAGSTGPGGGSAGVPDSGSDRGGRGDGASAT